MSLEEGVVDFLAHRDVRPRSRTVYGHTISRLRADWFDVALSQLRPRRLVVVSPVEV